ncbi:acyl-CoA dehydrogenase family protein [Sphingobium sp. EM0848]|uniref:acyl-CoA dehydrogenase family protein n=1 Tax=Sphingobium sp. EM0848 TaxID=2743473 RepID=UPI00159C4066|nr:acyl-CoA dehydrogenase family protein [Sphingobium sp. EM0848]
MDFNDTPEEAAFRAEVRDWLSRHAQPKSAAGGQPLDPEAKVERARKFLAAKAKAGYAAITLSKEYGGLGGTEIQNLIFMQEQEDFDVDTLHGSEFFSIGLHLCLGTLMHCGTDEQRERFIGPLLRGDEIWCQLFSEPYCGSDLAAVRTRAVRDGDDWLLTGQKVWTTGGHYADFGLALTRTDPTVPKHKGMTMFIVDMRQAGVEVQPIKQMSGEAEFNQIFLDNVRVPDSCRIGPVNEGWKVALVTLGQERSTAGSLAFVEWQHLWQLATQSVVNGRPAIEDERVREKIAQCWLNGFGVKLMNYRTQTTVAQGGVPGPEESMGKLIVTNQGQRSAMDALDMLGALGIMSADNLGDEWAVIERAWYWSPAFRLAGGADEILRNILAERVLGLPADIRVDRTVPFNELCA